MRVAGVVLRVDLLLAKLLQFFRRMLRLVQQFLAGCLHGMRGLEMMQLLKLFRGGVFGVLSQMTVGQIVQLMVYRMLSVLFQSHRQSPFLYCKT